MLTLSMGGNCQMWRLAQTQLDFCAPTRRPRFRLIITYVSEFGNNSQQKTRLTSTAFRVLK
jgi:hypothetical protein